MQDVYCKTPLGYLHGPDVPGVRAGLPLDLEGLVVGDLLLVSSHVHTLLDRNKPEQKYFIF